ncbi:MAG: PulJ/GspJ family protein [Candidatus Rifleibacteriota bacterium]
MKKQAFTLVEIMIVVIISAITMGPVYLIYRSGMRSSISGMVSLEIQSEGERLLLQIYDDLKNSCLPYDGELKLKFSDLVKVEHLDTSSLAGLNYSFHSFMRDENKLISATGNGKALRATRKIKYLIEKTDNPRLFALFRSEQTKSDGIVKRLISNRVAFFQINPVTIPSKIDNSSQYFWQITIQLAELPKSLPAGTYAANRSKGIIIADFYQVVSCDFFNNTLNFPHVNRNWYSGLEKAE